MTKTQIRMISWAGIVHSLLCASVESHIVVFHLSPSTASWIKDPTFTVNIR